MLQLRPSCECCDKALPPGSTEARICSFECTFCASCVETVLHGTCPNCGGNFVARPIRPAIKLAANPASAERVYKPAGCAKVNLGANLVFLAGIGLVGYGLMFLVQNFTGFIELGLTPAHIGGTPDEIRAFSPHLYNYISHLQVAVAGFIISLGIAVIALAWNGIRTGQRWALWTAFAAPVVGVAIALPLHFVYGLGTLGHLGLIYLDAAILLVGTVFAAKALPAKSMNHPNASDIG